MPGTLQNVIGPLIGYGIAAVLLFFLALPLLVGLVMALKVVRYRDWLAVAAAILSTLILAESGNYLYNLVHWTSSRLSPTMNVVTCALTLGTPPFLLILILARSRRRWLCAGGTLLLMGLAVAAIVAQYGERRSRDAEAYRQAVKPLGPRTGTPLVRWWRDERQPVPRTLLQGHVPQATPVVLLTDPFTSAFDPQLCTGVAAAYTPPARDPAELGNVTAVADLKGCAARWNQGLAVLERPVTSYQAVAFQPFAGGPDRDVLSRPLVRQRFSELHYQTNNFDLAKAEIRQAASPRQPGVFITTLAPLHTAPNAFPCSGPVAVVSVHDLANVQAVLPYCALNWNLFTVDNDLYLAAVTQEPTPPGEEIMNPDVTYWLLRVEGTDLKQVWPSP
jgi:hypothetical protein